VPATLEALETSGVPLIGYRTDVFPLFYVRESPHPVPDRADDAEAIAAAAAAHWGFARSTGIVVAQPVAEEAALDATELERTIDAAVADAAAAGLRGPAVTPYVLAAVHAATAGASLEANARLVVDNAGLAAEIAVAYYS
jgi:pseudouridylate synthase